MYFSSHFTQIVRVNNIKILTDRTLNIAKILINRLFTKLPQLIHLNVCDLVHVTMLAQETCNMLIFILVLQLINFHIRVPSRLVRSLNKIHSSDMHCIIIIEFALAQWLWCLLRTGCGVTGSIPTGSVPSISTKYIKYCLWSQETNSRSFQ